MAVSAKIVQEPMPQASNLARIEVAPIVPRKTAWVLGGLAVLFLLGGSLSMWQAYRSRARWQTTEARVGYSEVIRFGDETNPRYRLQVEFSYTVGRDRQVVPLSLPSIYSDRKAADEEAIRYRTGSVHRIYYDVDQPYSMLLDPGSAKRFYVAPLLLTAIGIILGGVLVFKYLRSSRYFCVVCGTSVEEIHAFCFHCGSRIPARKGKMIE
jgi:hypothetical protein